MLKKCFSMQTAKKINLIHEGTMPLPWSIRMKIALGAAKGLAFLHEEAERPVIYRDFKTSNILLDAVSARNYNKIAYFLLFVSLILPQFRTTMPSSQTLVLPKMVQKVIKPMCLLEWWEPMVMQHQNMSWRVSLVWYSQFKSACFSCYLFGKSHMLMLCCCFYLSLFC